MAYGILRTFKPTMATQNVGPGLAALTLTLNNTQGTRAIRLYNKGTDTVFVDFTSGANSATTTTSMPLAPGAIEIFTVAHDVTTMSYIGLAGGNTLYSTIGEGL